MTGRPIRASDQDRDEAVLALSDHYAEGRLDHTEFESRMAAASQATYLSDLDPLFVDLPLRARSTTVAEVRRPVGVGRPRRPRLPLVPLVVLAAAVSIVVMQGHGLWLLVPLWWVGLAVARRRAWQRRWAHAGIPPYHDRHGASLRSGTGRCR